MHGSFPQTISVILLLICILSTNSLDLRLCTKNDIDKYPFKPISGLREHGYTSRGLDEMVKMMPFVNLSSYRSNSTNILEIGCGGGRAMMEIQATLPLAKCICTNKDGEIYCTVTC